MTHYFKTPSALKCLVDDCGPLDEMEDYTSLKKGGIDWRGGGRQAASSIVQTTPLAYLFSAWGYFSLCDTSVIHSGRVAHNCYRGALIDRRSNVASSLGGGPTVCFVMCRAALCNL